MRRSKEDAARTREELLDSALEVFVRNGLSAARLEDVAAGAGVTRGAVYWHFKNKQDLYEALLLREHQAMGRMIGAADPTSRHPAAELRRLMGDIVRNFYRHERFRKFVELTWFKAEGRGLPGELRYKSEMNQLFLARAERLLDACNERGELRASTEPRDIALHLTCLINGLYRLYFVVPDRAAGERTAERLIVDYLDSVLAEKEIPA